MESIINKEEKSTAIAVKLSLEFLTVFEMELRDNPGLTVSEFYQKYLKHIQWDQPDNPYPLINQGSLLAHLYGMIVYPWETLKASLPAGTLLNDLSQDEWGIYEIISLPNGQNINQLPFEFFIRKLRNAISHGRVKVDSAMNFFFSDQDGTIIKYGINELEKFIYKFYNSYLNDWKFNTP